MKDAKWETPSCRVKGPHFLSRLQASRRAAVEQAARDTGFDVRVAAYSGDLIEIITHDERAEHGPFWRRYREIVEQEDKGEK